MIKVWNSNSQCNVKLIKVMNNYVINVVDDGKNVACFRGLRFNL